MEAVSPAPTVTGVPPVADQPAAEPPIGAACCRVLEATRAVAAGGAVATWAGLSGLATPAARGRAGGRGCVATGWTGAARFASEPVVALLSTLLLALAAKGLVKALSPKRDESLLQAAEALASRTAAMNFRIPRLSQETARLGMTQHPERNTLDSLH